MFKKSIQNTCLIFLCFYFSMNFPQIPPVFAQGMEYLRIRSTHSDVTQEPNSSQNNPSQVYFVNTGDPDRVLDQTDDSNSNSPVPPKDYFINAGDTIQVFVWQNPDLSMDVIVAPDGKMSYPLVGSLQASGLTIDQLAEKITRKVAVYVKDPKVSLMIKAFAPKKNKEIKDIIHKITVLGAVGHPGIFTYKGELNLIDAIAMAGYFNDQAKEDNVMIIRGHEIRKIKVNLSEILSDEDLKVDVMNLKPNDIVFVPAKIKEEAGISHKIIILGEVNYPGMYTYTGQTINLIDAIAMAGYFNDKAREDSIMIIRRGSFEFQADEFKETMTPEALIKALNTSKDIDIPYADNPINSLNKLLEKPELYRTMKIQPSESLAFISKLENRQELTTFEIQKLNRLLIEANYPLETPQKPRPDILQPVVLRVNLAQALRNGDPKININLNPNDIVVVPKSFIANFNKFLMNINPMLATADTVVQVGTGVSEHPFK
jgi:protein involved in polysaccharide export with SLBB domain